MRWPEFTFFDVIPVRDPSPPDNPLYSDPNVLAIVASERSTTFLTTRSGLVREFDQDLQVVTEWVATVSESQSLDFISPIVAAPNLVVTCATQVGEPIDVRVWSLSTSGDGKDPKLHGQIYISNAANTYPLTCIALNENASVTAFGFADGAVIVARGDILRDRGSRQRTIHSASSAITGLALAAGGEQLFVASLDQVAVVSTGGGRTPARVLDRGHGAPANCSGLVDGNDFLVGRDSDIVRYTLEHRSAAVEIGAPKARLIPLFGGKYVVVVTVWGVETALSTQSVRVVILDIPNSLVAYSGHLAPGIRFIWEQWDRLNVVGTDGILYVLTEISLAKRIAALTSQQLFQTAIRIAGVSGDKELQRRLHQDYADSLWSRNDTDGALKHYVAALGSETATSHAVIHFKESQHAPQLVAYLKAVYDRGFATPQHITLLITGLARLAQVEELTGFIHTIVSAEDAQDRIDFSSVIDVLVEARYYLLATEVAEAWPDPDLVVEIKLRDLHDPAGCLDYLYTVAAADALRILTRHSRTLLQALPVETTGVLITLFTGKFVTRTAAEHKHQRLAENKEPATDQPVLQSYQAFINYIGSTNFLGSRLVSAETLEAHDTPLSYQPPRPRLIFPSFIGRENEFVVFLEACLQSAPDFSPSDRDLSDIATTLFEVYVTLARSTGDQEWEQKARSLIDARESILDVGAVRTVISTYALRLEEKHLVALGWTYSDIFRDKLGTHDYDGALSIISEHVADENGLAIEALRLLTAGREPLEHLRATDELNRLFKIVSVVLTPVQIIQEVCQSPFVVVQDIKTFLENYMAESEKEIQRHNKLADSYASETAEKRKEVEDKEHIVFQYGNCALCNMALDLPTVHFACKHSYHQRCLGGSTVCRLCAPENEAIASLQASNAIQATRQDLFFDELSRKKGSARFRYMTDFIARGGLSSI